MRSVLLGVQQPMRSEDGLYFAEKRICILMPILRYFICQENCMVSNPALIQIKKQNGTNDDIDWEKKYKILLFYPEVSWLSKKIVQRTLLKWELIWKHSCVILIIVYIISMISCCLLKWPLSAVYSVSGIEWPYHFRAKMSVSFLMLKLRY